VISVISVFQQNVVTPRTKQIYYYNKHVSTFKKNVTKLDENNTFLLQIDLQQKITIYLNKKTQPVTTETMCL
jgi:hypothetical protein